MNPGILPMAAPCCCPYDVTTAVPASAGTSRLPLSKAVFRGFADQRRGDSACPTVPGLHDSRVACPAAATLGLEHRPRIPPAVSEAPRKGCRTLTSERVPG
jgi:hypothetical protein